MFDIAIIGGGINGCGIARDAAGRGCSVVLAEMEDLAGGTSSWSTKLIHGGLRYLEHYEFRLVREALKEREVLWGLAPHIVEPVRLVLPHHEGLRPAWLLRLGLFIYDHIGGRTRLPGARSLNLRKDPAGGPLKPDYARAFEFSDCRVDDARLVVLNARDAADRGADIRTRTRATGARRRGGHWELDLRDETTGATETVEAKLLVNAAGPWVDLVLNDVLEEETRPNVRLVQGSHIVVPKLYDHDRCYFFQNADERIVFAIPFERDFTLIGTTDHDFEGDPRDAAISQAETDYLCSAVSGYFRQAVTPDQVVWSFAGVRPLYDDGATKAQEATRDYVLKTDETPGGPALINIFGGKLTTYRKLAEAAMEEAERFIGARGAPWTASAPLPGGDFPVTGLPREVERLRAAYGFLDGALAERLVHAYGTRAHALLDGAAGRNDLGPEFGAGLYAREVEYLVAEEWARTADDILWRRSKLGLRFSENETKRLAGWLAEEGARLVG